ncbi:MAG: hypothetical protein GJT30_14885 [Geobacter sp.]|nr:hypothetical protein [Geobacter sp.]
MKTSDLQFVCIRMPLPGQGKDYCLPGLTTGKTKSMIKETAFSIVRRYTLQATLQNTASIDMKGYFRPNSPGMKAMA